MSESSLREPIIWDFRQARSCSLIHKMPYKSGTRKHTLWYDENGEFISDIVRKYREIKKTDGVIAADMARKKWTSKDKEVHFESYYVDKFWEVSGIVIGRRDDWMYSLAMVPDKRPFVIGENSLDKIIAAKADTMNVMQPPRHELCDWTGIGVESFFMPLVIRKLGIKCHEIDNPHFYPPDEILLIANETVSASRQYYDWWIEEYPGGIDNPYLKESLAVLPSDDVQDVIGDRLVRMFYDVERDLNELNSSRIKFLELMKDIKVQEPECWKNGFLF